MTTSALAEKPSVEAKNQRVLDRVRDRLGENTDAGKCILHLNSGGEIRRVEWRHIENVDDMVDH